MKDPLPIATLPWLLILIPRFSRVPPNTVYIVAICRVVAFLAALSDYQIKFNNLIFTKKCLSMFRNALLCNIKSFN